MRINTVKFLICPNCKKPLEILKIEEEKGVDIKRGYLSCGKCNKIYRIVNGVLVIDEDFFKF